MPNSSLEEAVLVRRLSYVLPSKSDLVAYTQERIDASVITYSEAVKAQTKFSIAHFFTDSGLVLPDESEFVADLAESTAMRVLYQNFYELVKNSMDEDATVINIDIFQNNKNEVEVVVSDTQPGMGFFKDTGSFRSYFAEGQTRINYQSHIVDLYERPQSKKVRGESLGGKGKGLSFMNLALEASGGKLHLEYQKEFPAIIRLVSKLHYITPLVCENVSEEDFALTTMLYQFSLKSVVARAQDDDVKQGESPRSVAQGDDTPRSLHVNIVSRTEKEDDMLSPTSGIGFFDKRESGLHSPSSIARESQNPTPNSLARESQNPTPSSFSRESQNPTPVSSLFATSASSRSSPTMDLFEKPGDRARSPFMPSSTVEPPIFLRLRTGLYIHPVATPRSYKAPAPVRTPTSTGHSSAKARSTRKLGKK